MPRKKGQSKFSDDEFDEQFQAFLKQPVSSEDSFDVIPTKTKKKKSPGLWWIDDDDKIGSGLSSSGKSFLKSKKSPEKETTPKSQKAGKVLSTKAKAKPEKARIAKKKEVSPKRAGGRGRTEASMSKDSLEDISEKSEENDHADAERISGIDSSVDTTRESNTELLTDRQETPERPGMDTLDELADKQRFFNEVEANGTIDYEALNRELSHTGATLSPLVGRRTEEVRHRSQDVLHPDGQQGQVNNSGTLTDKVAEGKEPSLQKPSMLSKVSLLDSLDSTLNTTTSPKASVPGDGSREGLQDHLGQTMPDTLKTRTGTGVMGTNTSKEIEALHEALREVGMSPTIRQDDKTDRTVDEIFREMTELEKQVKAREGQDENVKLRSDYHSPRSHSSSSPRSQSRGLPRQQHVDDDHRAGGFDHSHTDDTEVYQPVTQVSVKERKGKDSTHVKPSEEHTARGKKPKYKYEHVQSSGYGRRSPSRSTSRSPSRSPAKPKNKTSKTQTWSPADVSHHKIIGTQSPRTARQDTTGKRIPETNLLQSVESFANYIRDHYSGKPLPEVKHSDEEPSLSASLKGEKSWIGMKEKGSSVEQHLLGDLSKEREEHVKLRGEVLKVQQNFEEEIEKLKVEHEQDLFKLKQENFVLAAKMNEGENQSVARRALGEVLSGDAVTREQLTMLESEIKEQEALIAGYQTENKKLYEDMKLLRAKTRTAEEKMFSENQRLVTEVTSLKSQLERKELELRNKGIITSLATQQKIAAGNADVQLGASKISQLESELKEAKKQNEFQQREMKVLQESKFELDQHIHQLVKEREDLKHRLADAEKITPQQLKELEKQHEEVVSGLKRKLRWYAENQELLDKGVASLKKKDDEIRELKLRLDGLATEAGRKLEENRLRAKERASDARKIQDLQRQVKEMEQIIRRRHPNSLPALIMAAATAPDEQARPEKTISYTVLEDRIKKLESELDKKDEESNTMLRAMEQKYNNVKLKFEARIADLEKQLSIYQRSGDSSADHPHTHVAALEYELTQVRERYKRQVTDLQTEVDRLTGELTKLQKNQQNMMKNESSRAPDSDLSHQVALLQRELDGKKQDIQVLQTSLEKIRKEKVETSINNTDSSKKARSKVKGKKKGSTEFASFPAGEIQDKSYEPQTFADSDITEVLQENEELRIKMENLQLELDQQRVDLRKSLAETEAYARLHREEYEEQINSLRLSHQEEIKRVLGNQAIQHSVSKLAQLQSKCDSQEVMVQHLQQQLTKAEVDAEQISVLKIREAAKSAQIEKLQDLLEEAKKSHSPEMRHFESLQEKIIQMERRHEQRETELKQIIANTRRVASQELEEEVTKWQKIVELKNSEIQKFRAELDSILDVLRVLQKQGVILPAQTAYT